MCVGFPVILLRDFSCPSGLSVPNYIVSQGQGLYLSCPLTFGRQTSAQHIGSQNREWDWLDPGGGLSPAVWPGATYMTFLGFSFYL